MSPILFSGLERSFLLALGVLAFSMVVLLSWFFRKRGYFISHHSLILRANLPLLFKNPVIFVLPTIEWLPPGKRLRNFVSNIVRLFLYCFLTLLIVVLAWIVTTDLINVGVGGFLQIAPQMWQVHATIAGFSFVALLFYWETLTVKTTVSGAVAYLTENTEVLGTVYTLLLSNALIGATAWWAQIWLSEEVGTSQSTITIIEIFFASFSLGAFIVTLVVLIGFYEGIYHTLFKTGIEQSTLESFTAEINDLTLGEPNPPYSDYINRISSVKFPEYFFQPDWQAQHITAEDLSVAGETISDVHLGRLQKAVRQLELNDENIEIRVRPGTELRSRTRIAQLTPNQTTEQVEEFKKQLRSAIRTKA